MKVLQRIINTITSVAAWAGVSFSDTERVVGAAIDYITSMNLKVKFHGKPWVAERYKQYYVIAKSISMDLKFSPLPWVKSNKRGIPKALMPMLYLLEGSTTQKRLGLTICRSFELLVGEPKPKLEPITDPGLEIPTLFIQEFTEWTERWLSSTFGNIPCALESSQSMKSSLGTNGPNGPSLVTSHLDAWAIYLNPPLIKAISVLSPYLYNEICGIIVNSDKPQHPLRLSRITFLAERGMKTRTIAIGDYWTQNALRPVHDKLMSMLKRMETDGTYDQDLQSERIAKMSNDQSHSFDLSSATDRFPMKLIEILISHIFGKDIMNSWSELMINRDFYHKDIGSVRWTVGQPLGFYSSWAAFSLTHHAIIEFAAFRVGFRSFRNYAVLGDDVVIWNCLVAREYEYILNLIGVTINKSKSIIAAPGSSASEFAKRLFRNGEEISGISWGVMLESHNLSGLAELYLLLKSRGWDLKDDGQFKAPNYLSIKAAELLQVLLFERTSGMVPLLVNHPQVTLESLKREVVKLRLNRLKSLKDKLGKIAESNKTFTTLFSKEGLDVNPKLFRSDGDQFGFLRAAVGLHPICAHYVEQLRSVISIIELLGDGELGFEPDFIPVEYFPDLNISNYFGDRRVMSRKHHSKLVWKAYYNLLGETSAPKFTVF